MATWSGKARSTGGPHCEGAWNLRRAGERGDEKGNGSVEEGEGWVGLWSVPYGVCAFGAGGAELAADGAVRHDALVFAWKWCAWRGARECVSA